MKRITNRPIYREDDEVEYDQHFVKVKKCVSCGLVNRMDANSCLGCKHLLIKELTYDDWEARNTRLNEMKDKIKEELKEEKTEDG